jgi:hypothetical protein
MITDARTFVLEGWTDSMNPPLRVFQTVFFPTLVKVTATAGQTGNDLRGLEGGGPSSPREAGSRRLTASSGTTSQRSPFRRLSRALLWPFLGLEAPRSLSS